MPAKPIRADAAVPQEDDVVIIYTNGHWEVGLASQPAGISWATRDEALALVRRFAERRHVDVWISRDGGRSYVSAVRCRAAAQGRCDAKDETPAMPLAVVHVARGADGPHD
ncbi:MAG TPA: hypothetical protein VIK60_07645 [Vicinamibacterales bacterium]